MKNITENKKLKDSKSPKSKWKKWGPYLTERQWGTVREDYSANGNAWDYVSYDDARSKTYRWGEDGIAGISDDKQLLCFSVALWNKKDHIIKERLFGLTGNQGNHGEDVKEYYYYLDSTPTHSYMKMLYKFPQNEFPYRDLIYQNYLRTKTDEEYELIDTGIFDDDKYYDVFIEYAKIEEEDIAIKISVHNRGSDDVELNVIPQIWFRNTWAWGYDDYKPSLSTKRKNTISVEHKKMGNYNLYCSGKPELLFCENETNVKRLYNVTKKKKSYYKDGINDYIVKKEKRSVNPKQVGTKAAANYNIKVKANNNEVVYLRLSKKVIKKPFAEIENIFESSIRQADNFYKKIQKGIKVTEYKNLQREAFAGMLWSKQFYYFDVPQYVKGDPGQPPPPPERKNVRNSKWAHLNNFDIISVPDKWEYPWYAAWDLAFHAIPYAIIDPEFAKTQLLLLTKEWYMHPNGQLPAYEWEFGDVNPPVHAWAAWRVYKMDKNQNNGKGDLVFLESIFHKLLLNFTWWVNRKDNHDNNVFQGGFLGLDNIGVFDRSSTELPTGGYLEQADGTAWMGMFSLNLMRISLELAKHNPVYQDTATKFFEHFLYIAGAMANVGEDDLDMWDDEDEFYYDLLHSPNGDISTLKVRSIVGIIPLFAVEVLDPKEMECVPEFAKRAEWFLKYRPDLANLISRWKVEGTKERRLFSLLRGHRMKMLLKRMLDETEFLSDYGVRALSKYHKDHPYEFKANGEYFHVSYQPGESDSYMFGGNSNWRGPIWLPINFLIIESLQRFHHYYSDDFKVEHPTNSGKFLTLNQIADELTKRLLKIFIADEKGEKPFHGKNKKFQTDPHLRIILCFMNISTATMEGELELLIKLAGQDSLLNYYNHLKNRM
ncbi:MAG: glucosidase [Melioribacteraceae bacterium]